MGIGAVRVEVALPMSLLGSPLVYLILTNAGRPVYYSKGDEEDVIQYVAVIQAIVSCFDNDSALESIQSGSAQIVVMTSCQPLVIAAIDKEHRGIRQIKAHLALLHSQILSVLTKQQLERQIKQKPNIDLRPMLGGTKVFLDALSKDFERCAPWSWLGALETLEMRRKMRGTLNDILLTARADSSLLYGVILSNRMLAGVVRPKQHSIHPPDMHLLNSMLFNTSVFEEGEHWVPICFPRFNPNGFLYAYITHLDAVSLPTEEAVRGETDDSFPAMQDGHGRDVSPSLVLVSPNKQGFFEMQKVAQTVQRMLASQTKLMQSITLGYDPAKNRIDPASIDAEPIRYFVYKSRRFVQFFQSQFITDENGVSENEVNLLFAQLQAKMLAQHQRVSWSLVGEEDTRSIFGWCTPAFELYCYAATADKELVSAVAKKLSSWARRQEGRLFVIDGASF